MLLAPPPAPFGRAAAPPEPPPARPPAPGLTSAEAAHRLQQVGPNVLAASTRESLLWLAARQFYSLTVLVLGGAGAASVLGGDYLEGAAIGAVVLLNAAIGFGLEWQTRAAMDALHALDMPHARALRDGQPQAVPAATLVPGDVLLLASGDLVPADAELLEAHQLQVNEAALTGESLPVGKHAGAPGSGPSLAEQPQRVFKGTAVVAGHGRARVVATGPHTELGRIAHLVQTTRRPPALLEAKLDHLAAQLLLVTAALAGLYVLVGWGQGRPLGQVIEMAVVLAVAAIPEGLAIVATLALALGAGRLARHRVLVKHLPAVETLCSTTVIFTDKTGTLTHNQLQVQAVWLAVGRIELGLGGAGTGGAGAANAAASADAASPDFDHLRQLAGLCNNARYVPADPARTTGDPLEVALGQLAASAGGLADLLRLAEQPFSAETRLMGTLHQLPAGRCLVAVKGAAEAVLPHCRHQWTAGGQPQLLTPAAVAAWLARVEVLAGQGLRTLAFASAELPELPGPDFVRDLAWVGLVAFLDAPRLEVAEALATCHRAGVRVVMVTGDHPATARTVAAQVGLFDAWQHDEVVTGAELPALLTGHPNGAGRRRLHQARVFARVSPTQKLDLIALHQHQGAVVGMTGDGVNDAPALRRADIGIAMGLRGTQVAAEAADLVLQDDAFGSVVVAIEQGRLVLSNIRTFLRYLISCNLSEVLVITAVGLLHAGRPLLPLQILFLNLLTDVFPALALAMGHGPAGLMQGPPRPPHCPLLSPADWLRTSAYALALLVGSAGAFGYAHWGLHLPGALTNNVLFYTLALSQLLHVFNFAGDHHALLRTEVTRNPYVWGALGLCLAALAGSYGVPALRALLGLVPLPAVAWQVVAVGSLLPLLLLQAARRLAARPPEPLPD